METKECVISIISEDYIEYVVCTCFNFLRELNRLTKSRAADFTSIDSPPGVSEWILSGLHQAPSSVVKPPRVAESRFSIECKLLHHYEISDKLDKMCTGGVLILEGLRFHVAEAALDEEHTTVDHNILKPVARLGGITYGRMTEGFELPKHLFKDYKDRFVSEN